MDSSKGLTRRWKCNTQLCDVFSNIDLNLGVPVSSRLSKKSKNQSICVSFNEISQVFKVRDILAMLRDLPAEDITKLR